MLAMQRSGRRSQTLSRPSQAGQILPQPDLTPQARANQTQEHREMPLLRKPGAPADAHWLPSWPYTAQTWSLLPFDPCKSHRARRTDNDPLPASPQWGRSCKQRLPGLHSEWQEPIHGSKSVRWAGKAGQQLTLPQHPQWAQEQLPRPPRCLQLPAGKRLHN